MGVSFSVVIPVYNGAKYIERCLTSVMSQSYRKFEVVMVDDGSVDGSVEVMQRYVCDRVRLVCQKNMGVSVARNVGIENSENEVIAFIDCDDEWFSNHLEVLAGIINENNNCGIYCTGYRINDEDSSCPVNVFVDTKKRHSIEIMDPFPYWSVIQINHCSNTAINKKIIMDCGGFPSGVQENEDIDLWIKVSMKYPLCVSSYVTSIVNKTPIDEKPRYRSRPNNIPACVTAMKYIDTLGVESRISLASIGRYVRAINVRYFWSSIANNQKKGLSSVLKNSGGEIYAKEYIYFLRHDIWWFFLRIISFVRNIFKSRLMMCLMGGRKSRNSIVNSFAFGEVDVLKCVVLFIHKK